MLQSIVASSFQVRIDEVITKHFRETGCFMRLCGRSAKDAEPRDRERIRKEYVVLAPMKMPCIIKDTHELLWLFVCA